MKTSVNIITLLILMITVSFTTNAQQYLPYSMDVNDISDWTDAGTTSGVTGGAPIAEWGFPTHVDIVITYEMEFNLTDMDSLLISYDFSETTNTPTGYDYTFRVYIDNVLTDIDYTSNGTTSTMMITHNTTFVYNSMIRFEFKSLSPSTSTQFMSIAINQFNIEGYSSNGSNVGITENDLSNEVEVYSYNKSIFITANDYMNADVTVYNMSGQVVYSENTELSLSKTELDLSNLEHGTYIAKIQNEQGDFSRRIVLQ